jgi:hypothetical protein
MRRLLERRDAAVDGLRTASDVFKAVREGIDLFNVVSDKVKSRKIKTYSIYIDEINNPHLYELVLAWCATQIPVQDVRRFELTKHRREAVFLYSTDKVQFVNLNGHKIKIFLDSGNGQPKQSSSMSALADGEQGRAAWGFRKLTFEAENVDGLAAIRDFLVEKVSESERSPSRMMSPTGYGWKFAGAVPQRPIESVILRDGLMESILADIDRFRAEEERYADLGIPWHRGYLLYGPPGTGKTSIAQLLAAYMNTDVYLLGLSGVENDRKLYDLAADINRDGSVVILEDFDTVKATSDRKVDDGVTMAGLLNFLDGSHTPSGMVSIMTTNHVDDLDPALIRPGRADRIIEIDYLVHEQFVRLCDRFLNNTKGLPKPDGLEITPADIVDIFKSNFDDVEKARRDAIAFVRERKREKNAA